MSTDAQHASIPPRPPQPPPVGQGPADRQPQETTAPPPDTDPTLDSTAESTGVWSPWRGSEPFNAFAPAAPRPPPPRLATSVRPRTRAGRRGAAAEAMGSPGHGAAAQPTAARRPERAATRTASRRPVRSPRPTPPGRPTTATVMPAGRLGSRVRLNCVPTPPRTRRAAPARRPIRTASRSAPRTPVPTSRTSVCPPRETPLRCPRPRRRPRPVSRTHLRRPAARHAATAPRPLGGPPAPRPRRPPPAPRCGPPTVRIRRPRPVGPRAAPPVRARRAASYRHVRATAPRRRPAPRAPPRKRPRRPPGACGPSARDPARGTCPSGRPARHAGHRPRSRVGPPAPPPGYGRPTRAGIPSGFPLRFDRLGRLGETGCLRPLGHSPGDANSRPHRSSSAR